MQHIKENEMIRVEMNDGTEYGLMVWKLDKQIVALTLSGVNSDKVGFFIDIGVNPETEVVTGPDLVTSQS